MDMSILQNRYLILPFFGGLVLVLAMVLMYLAYWQPRPTEGQEPSGAPAPRSMSTCGVGEVGIS